MSDPYIDDFGRILVDGQDPGNESHTYGKGHAGQQYSTPPFPLNVLPVGKYTDENGKEDLTWAIPGILTEPGRFTEEYFANPTRANGEKAAGAISSLVGGGAPFMKAPSGSVAMAAARRDAPHGYDLGDTFDLPMGNHAPMPARSEVAAPAVRRAEGELFDYSHHDGMPSANGAGVPDTPYYEGARGTTRRAAMLQESPAVQRSLNKAVDMGLKENPGAATNWYNMEPLRERFHDLYKGEGKPDDAFVKLMQAVGTTSMQNPALPNAANATQIYERLQKGLGIPNKTEKYQMPGSFLTPGAETRLEASQKRLGNRQDEYSFKDAPKSHYFGDTLAGLSGRVTVDSHAMRGLVMPTKNSNFLRTNAREMGEDGAYQNINPKQMFDNGELGKLSDVKPSFWYSRPTAAEYKDFAEPFHKAAKKFSISPEQAQAAAWYGNAEKTGVKTPPQTFNELFEQRLRENARDRNIDPEKLLDDVINGRTHLKATAVPVQPPFTRDEQIY